LTGLSQGTSKNQRVGRDIIVKSIHIKGILDFVATTAADTTDIAYIYVILDTAANGGTAGSAPCLVADLFSNTSVAEQLLNPDNTDRFRVLKVIKHTFQAQTFTPGGVPIQMTWPFDIYIPMNMKVVYSGTAGNQSELRTNQIFLAYGSLIGKVVALAASRIRFTDV